MKQVLKLWKKMWNEEITSKTGSETGVEVSEKSETEKSM